MSIGLNLIGLFSLLSVLFLFNDGCGVWNVCPVMEQSSSAVECQTRDGESPGSNPLCYRFEVWAFSFSPRCPNLLSSINEYLAIGGNVSE